jgi:hypothetical protein
MAFNRSFNAEEQARLKQLIKEGIQATYEMEILREGLRDTVKAVAEEMDIKPALLNKAIKIAHKNNYHEQNDDWDTIDTILDITKHK